MGYLQKAHRRGSEEDHGRRSGHSAQMVHHATATDDAGRHPQRHRAGRTLQGSVPTFDTPAALGRWKKVSKAGTDLYHNFFATQFEKLLEKYRHEKPAELQRFLTAKIKECEAQSTQPGATASDIASAIERLQHELSALQKSAEPRTKSKRKTPTKSA